MFAVLGIGNPGTKYRFTRHNAGFLLLDYFAEKHSLNFKASKDDFYFSEGSFNDNNFLLVKPTTYVNNSGFAAKYIVDTYNIRPENILVLVDDINLPVGSYRVRLSGGDGGHNGLNSLIYHLNSNSFPRIRIGVSSEFAKGRMADYVLSPFETEEEPLLKEVFDKSLILIESFLEGGVKKMTDENSKMQSNSKDN